jgi:hypothetical protein
MLAVGVAVMAMIWRPTRRTLNLIGLGLLLFVALLITDLRIDLGYREVSARQFLANVSSLVGSDEAASSLDATTTRNKDWRSAWWDAIYSDAVDNNRYVIGLGWGTNLADEFGFQTVDSDVNALRNPHNALLGILARGGWLAAGLWVSFYLLLLYGLWQAARRFQDDRARQDMAWIIMIYVLASQINGATDVFLESPQNAIPHWIVIGVGWVLIRDAQHLAAYGELPVTPAGRPPRPPAADLLPAPAYAGGGIGRPLTPAISLVTRRTLSCPHLALDSDAATCGLSARRDHVCLALDGAGVGLAWQRERCLNDFRACPHWQIARGSTQAAPEGVPA